MKHCKSKLSLPEGYDQRSVINLRRDPKLIAPAFLINIITFAAAVLFECRRIPFVTMFGMVDGKYVLTIPRLLLNLVAILFGLLFSAILHILLKGALIRSLTGKRAVYGSKGWFVFVGCETYLARARYILLVVLPDLCLIVMLLFLCSFLPIRLFWVGYLILSVYISILATDLMLVILILFRPRDSYFRNMGTLTSVYSKVSK